MVGDNETPVDRLTDEQVADVIGYGYGHYNVAAALAREVQELRRWKAEATAVIDKWELAYDLIVPAGYARLGAFKQTELVNYVRWQRACDDNETPDIVTHLRSLAEEWWECCDNIHVPILAAADEIERLRELLMHPAS